MVTPSGFVGECYNKWNVEVIEIKGNIDMNDCQWRENVRNNNYSGLLAACGEVVLTMAESIRVSALMLEFNKQVNASIVNPEFIANVRKKLNLDQREAAEIFGGGINAFSRYENGKTKPPLALVKLLRILDRHPDLLAEIRTA